MSRSFSLLSLAILLLAAAYIGPSADAQDVPHPPDALAIAFATATEALANGNLAVAEEQFCWMASVMPDFPDYHYFCGIVRLERGRFHEATSPIERFLALSPVNDDERVYLTAVLKAINHGQVPPRRPTR